MALHTFSGTKVQPEELAVDEVHALHQRKSFCSSWIELAWN